MPLWIPITIAAAFAQNLRSALQRQLAASLDTDGATYVRFLYGWPVALAYLWGVATVSGEAFPEPNGDFLVFCLVGGLAQIAGTALLIASFRTRNFVVGTTYSKTETAQTALFGLIVLGDVLSPIAALAILISLAGVMAISVARTEMTLGRIFVSWTERAALLGLSSGAGFGISAVCYRAASLSLGYEGFALPAAYTLAWVLGIQTGVMTVWLLARGRRQLANSLRQWRAGSLVGLTGALGSIGWFSAMTLQNAAYVRALGQIELVFTFTASVLWFRERINRTEIVGVALVTGGILLLILG